MTTLKQATIKILDSNDKGQGSTLSLSNKLLVSDLGVDYLDGLLSFKFQTEAHKDAYLTMLMYKELKDKSPDYIERLFKHLNSGAYLSLNHGTVTSQTSVDRYKQFETLFSDLGIIRAESNGKGSKLHRLYCVPSSTIVDTLALSDIVTHDVLTDNYVVVGLKVELPKDEK